MSVTIPRASSLTTDDLAVLDQATATLSGDCVSEIDSTDTGTAYAVVIPTAFGDGVDAAFVISRVGDEIEIIDMRRAAFGGHGAPETLGTYATLDSVCVALRAAMGVAVPV